MALAKSTVGAALQASMAGCRTTASSQSSLKLHIGVSCSRSDTVVILIPIPKRGVCSSDDVSDVIGPAAESDAAAICIRLPTARSR